MAEDPTAKPPTSEEDGKNPAGKPEGKDTPPKPEDADKKFTQADLDRIAAKTREEEKRKAKEAKEKEDRERVEAEAKEQGKFEKLAADRQTQIEELTPKLEAATKELDVYKLKVSEMVAADLKDLPEEVRDMSPAQLAEDKSITNPLDVLAWLPKGKALAQKLNGQSAAPGAKADPKAKGPPGDAEKDKAAKAANASLYRRF